MKVLVEIDEIDFENLKRKDKIDRKFLTYYEKLIAYGTPLPKGCGRLVDVDRLEQLQNERLQNGEIKIWELKLITSALDAAETVVEADGGAE